jgi:hypothetical protein
VGLKNVGSFISCRYTKALNSTRDSKGNFCSQLVLISKCMQYIALLCVSSIAVLLRCSAKSELDIDCLSSSHELVVSFLFQRKKTKQV